VADLRTNGIAFSSLDDLFPGQDLLTKLQQYEKELRPGRAVIGKKPYIKYYWSFLPELTYKNPFVGIALDSLVLDIANSYLQMFTRFQYFRFEQTMPVGKNSERTHSQQWHRDPKERRYMKMFIYLNDVDDSAGPFVYIPGTTYGNPAGNVFPQKPPLGSYPPAEEVARLFPENTWKVARGVAGTVIFCDTSGIHRGGFATENDRLMSSFFYTADSYARKSDYTISSKTLEGAKDFSPALKYALRLF